MKFSFKSKVDINQSLPIVVLNKDIEEQVLIKLKKAQKESKLKGFRKGKAPLDVVEESMALRLDKTSFGIWQVNHLQNLLKKKI